MLRRLSISSHVETALPHARRSPVLRAAGPAAVGRAGRRRAGPDVQGAGRPGAAAAAVADRLATPAARSACATCWARSTSPSRRSPTTCGCCARPAWWTASGVAPGSTTGSLPGGAGPAVLPAADHRHRRRRERGRDGATAVDAPCLGGPRSRRRAPAPWSWSWSGPGIQATRLTSDVGAAAARELHGHRPRPGRPDRRAGAGLRGALQPRRHPGGLVVRTAARRPAPAREPVAYIAAQVARSRRRRGAGERDVRAAAGAAVDPRPLRGRRCGWGRSSRRPA